MKYSLGLALAMGVSAVYGQNQSWSQMMASPDANYYKVVKAFENQRGNLPYERGRGIKQFYRWKEYWSTCMLPDGSLPPAAKFTREIDSYLATHDFPTTQSEWTCLGPYNHVRAGSWAPGQGRVTCVAAHSSAPDTWYAGAAIGGVWKTTDAGNSWSAIGDDFTFIAVSSIAIPEQDPNILYVVTGDWDGQSLPSDGIMISKDGGATWDRTDMGLDFRAYRAGRLLVSPNDKNKIFVVTTVGLMRSEDGGQTWDVAIDDDMRDIDFKPGDGNVLYAVSNSKFYYSTDGGDTFQEADAGIASNATRTEIAVTNADPNTVYVFSVGASAFDGVFKSTNSGVSWTKISNASSVGGHYQAWYDLSFEVSDVDPNTIFVGTIDLYKSTNSGSSFTQINSWNRPSEATYTHADQHFLEYINGKLFCGSDGGIYVSEDHANSFEDLTAGMVIGQFYTLSVLDSRPDIMAGGLQDNGGYSYINGNWRNYAGADGMGSAVDPTNPNRIWGMQQNGDLYYSMNGGPSQFIGKPETGEWVTPMEIDNSGRIVAGFSQVYSYRNGWQQLSDHNFDEKLRVLALHENDPSIMVVGTKANLYRSTDNGATFTNITSNIETARAWVNGVDIHPTDPNKIWVVMAHWGVGNKCHYSDDGGQTWTNISEGLPNIPYSVVRYEKGSNNGIYVGGYVGVYYRSDETGTFVPIFDGLPRTWIKDIEINETEGHFRVGTHGRGVWQADLYSPPSANNDASISNISGVATEICGNFSPAAKLKNNGVQDVTSAEVSLLIDGQVAEKVNWSGSLKTGESVQVDFKELTVLKESFEVKYKVVMSGDEQNSNDETSSITINKSPLVVIPQGSDMVELRMEVKPDMWGSEVEWELTNDQGSVLLSGGPYQDANSLNDIQTDIQSLTVNKASAGCFDFLITDNGNGGAGDGMYNEDNPEWGEGYFKMTFDNETIFEGGRFGKSDSRTFEVAFSTSTEDVSTDDRMTLYPNPAQDFVQVRLTENTQGLIRLLDISGKLISEVSINGTSSTINLSKLSPGVYFIELNSDNLNLKKQLLHVE